MKDRLEEIITPIVQSLGYEFFGIETFKAGRRLMIRIYIDVLESTTEKRSVNADDCKEVSVHVGHLLEAEASLIGYTLEISSPGMNRKLFTLEQCKRYIGKKVKIKLKIVDENNKRNFDGELLSINEFEPQLILKVSSVEKSKEKEKEKEKENEDENNNNIVNFKFIDIEQIRLIPEWEKAFKA